MKKKIVGILIIFVFVILILLFNNATTFTTKSIYYNGNNLRVSIDGVESSTLPTSGSYYLSDYDCKSSNTKVTWDNDKYELNVSNGNKKGGLSCYLDFQSNPLLSSMEVGSYVSYIGDNDCSGDSCKGINANYLNDNEMGYCGDSKYKFTANGWRIGYIENGNVYLISAGATDCMCTSADGTLSNNSCSNYISSSDNLDKHFENMNEVSLKYCNADYVKGGVCNKDNSWAMNALDFEKITGNVLSSENCYAKYSDKSCGYANDLIDNGGDYWIASPFDSLSINVYNWNASYRYMSSQNSSMLKGVRPILVLESTVVVIDGDGTSENPYMIGNNTFWINAGATEVSMEDKENITLDLMAVNATQMCISTNTSVCTNYVDFNTSYTLNWKNEEAGEKIVYVYYKNASEEIIATMHRSIILSDL